MLKIRLNLAAAILVAFAFAAPMALAQAIGELPHYDVAALCKEAASFTGTYSALGESGCIDLEQTAYNKLKLMWDDTSDRIRKVCKEAAQAGGEGSYTSLLGCIALEEQAQTELPNKKFNY